jgi:hypothetical protein
MRSPSDATARARTPLWVWPLLIALLLVMAVALPVIAIALAVRLAAAAALLATVWLTWWTRGRYALVVYSNSPIWQEYFETHVLAALGSRGVVLNWSERRRWRLSLPVVLFRFFAGGREFNPWAIVFPLLPPLPRVQVRAPGRGGPITGGVLRAAGCAGASSRESLMLIRQRENVGRERAPLRLYPSACEAGSVVPASRVATTARREAPSSRPGAVL